MIVEPAPAKLNLALHVRARRPDGYHELETLFAFVADGDVVTLADGERSLAVIGPFSAGLSGERDNLVARAATLFAATFGTPDAGAFTLDKRLPVASGIGGGSADAAAALRALARRHGVAPNDARLFACADALGSDVPACLLGRTALGRGRGERLEPIGGLAGTPVLLVNPGVALSTAAVFRGWDGVDRGAMPRGDALSIALSGRNDLAAPALAIHPVIGEVLAMLDTRLYPSPQYPSPQYRSLEAGAQSRYADDRAPPPTARVVRLDPGLRRGSEEGVGEGQGRALAAPILARPILTRMSGSGATCFALYDRDDDRAEAAAAIRAARPGWWCLETRLA